VFALGARRDADERMNDLITWRSTGRMEDPRFVVLVLNNRDLNSHLECALSLASRSSTARRRSRLPYAAYAESSASWLRWIAEDVEHLEVARSDRRAGRAVVDPSSR